MKKLYPRDDRSGISKIGIVTRDARFAGTRITDPE
jgi:hypothetical protein